VLLEDGSAGVGRLEADPGPGPACARPADGADNEGCCRVIEIQASTSYSYKVLLSRDIQTSNIQHGYEVLKSRGILQSCGIQRCHVVLQSRGFFMSKLKK